MKILNLIRYFKLQKMKDSETFREYCNKLLSIANKVRLIDSEFLDSRLVQNFLQLFLNVLKQRFLRLKIQRSGKG